MCTKGEGVVALVPGEVVLDGEDILVQRVSHRVVLVTYINRAIVVAHLRNLNGREGIARSTGIADANIRGAGLIAHHGRKARLQLSHKGVGGRLVFIQVVTSIQRRDATATLHRAGVDIAPTDSKLVEVIDIPVEFHTSLVAPGAHIGVSILSVVIYSLLAGHILNSVEYLSGQFYIYLRTVRAQTVVVRNRLVTVLIVGKEEELVLDDGAAQGKTEERLILLRIRSGVAAVVVLIVAAH